MTPMEIISQLGKSKQIHIPAELVLALGVQSGDEIVMRLENDSIRLTPLRQSVKKAQAVIRNYVPRNISLVDELIQSRRKEARFE